MKPYTIQELVIQRRQKWEARHGMEADKTLREAIAEYITRQENKHLIQELQQYPEHLIELLFVIVDKDQKTVPFFLNSVQISFLNDLNKAKQEYKDGKRISIKFLILKGRQQGFTSFITAYQLACMILRKNFSGFTVADCNDNTASIFEKKAKFPYSKLPERIKPSEKYNNRRELTFAKLNSTWEIDTADKKIGRSRTINFLHGSEAAFWDVKISDIQAAIGEALTKDAIQIYESTANGFNEFKDLWDSGKWENKFYVWWDTPEYHTKFENEDRKAQFQFDIDIGIDWIHKRCRWLIDIGLSWEQVYWYYNKWDSNPDKEKIKQEYPCTPDEAFIASGNCVFDKEKVIQRKLVLERLYKDKPYIQGEFIIEWHDPEKKDYPISYTWSDNPNGCIKIYEKPMVGYPYVFGGDTKGEGSDRFAGTGINNATGNRCAALHGEMSSKDYTAQMWALGMYYNTSLLGIEINFNTYPIELLTDWNYPKQYQREIYDNFTGALKKAYGWKTNGNTRPLIIEKETTNVNENIDCINDIETLNEMMTFVKDKNGRPDAESGKHDDMLFSEMIANEIRGQQDYVPAEKEEEKKEKLIDKLVKKDSQQKSLKSW